MNDMVSAMPSVAARMMALFLGSEAAHGTHGEADYDLVKRKHEIKRTARTLPGGATEQMWADHLAGRRALGIIPIREDGKVWFTAGDVDDRDVDHGELYDKIERMGLPLIVDKSKSGGAHVYLFFSEPAPAAAARKKMVEIMAALGHPNCEVFPKQTELKANGSAVGNWLRMPHFGKGPIAGYGIKKRGLGMAEAVEFVAAAEAVRVRLDEVKVSGAKAKRANGAAPPDGVEFADGPPCLQQLAAAGFPEGTRNNGLFNIAATYVQKKFGDDLEELDNKVGEYNQRLMNPPLPSTEVAEIVQRHTKTHYQYRCKDQPLCSHCNAPLCRTREFGISGGGGGDYAVFERVVITTGEPVTWTITLEGGEITLTSDEVLDQRLFSRKCLSQLRRVFLPMKIPDWYAFVDAAAQSATVVAAPKGTTPEEEFHELMDEFLHNAYQGKSWIDIPLGKPFLNDDDGRHYFRMQDLVTFLDRERCRFRGESRKQLGRRIRTLGGDIASRKIKGKTRDLFWVAENIFEKEETVVALPTERPSPV